MSYCFPQRYVYAISNYMDASNLRYRHWQIQQKPTRLKGHCCLTVPRKMMQRERRQPTARHNPSLDIS